MKICFICGSLEPGKDGVGDYTRRLACELIRQGNKIKIIALNDRHITSSWQGYQNEEKTDIEVIRLCVSDSWNDRIKRIKDLICTFLPDLMSLQYVPFSFHEKGLPFGLAAKLKKVGRCVTWHIMFHELWVGINENALLEHKLVGYLQRLLIKRMIQTLSPKILHTQTRVYQAVLEKMKLKVKLLPLFSNIPIFQANKHDERKLDRSASFVLFGSIHPGAPVADFIEELILIAKEIELSLDFTFIGRYNAEIATWLAEFEKVKLPLTLLGEQPPHCVSKVLESASFGITTTPFFLVEKSGAVAAMLERHLPVISVASSWRPHFNFHKASANNIYEYKRGNLKTIMRQKKSSSTTISVSKTAGQFIADIWEVKYKHL